jgi:hypothetical protein
VRNGGVFQESVRLYGLNEDAMIMRTAFLLLTALLVLLCQALSSGPIQKNRVIVLTDIEADPDDTQSMVRLLLYSNVIDIKGLIATTSTHMRNQVHSESIEKVIRAYGKVKANLAKHEAGYPEAETLLRLVKRGLPEYGMKGIGEGKDSQGSEWILNILNENDERPLWITVWGGANTLAQALFKIRKTRGEADAQKLVAKLRVYTISDQDDTGVWMRNNFPDLFYIVSPGGYGGATWSAITEYAPGFNSEVISNKWLAKHLQQGHGPLGVVYPDVAYGMEGDTPSWLSLIPNGLNAPERPNWGGGAAGMNCTSRHSQTSMSTDSRAVCLWSRKREPFGLMPPIVVLLFSITNMAGRFAWIPLCDRATKSRCGAGERTSKTISRPGWIGARNPTKMPTTRLTLS